MPRDESLPFVSCLCPTYLRPKLLENAIACFLAQDYPADRRELVILDDAGQITPQKGDGWEVLWVPRRFRSLPEKFNALAGLARGNIFVIWEDDDVYLPWHVSSHANALVAGRFWSKPSLVLSTYPGEPVVESADGRFHASLALWRDFYEHVNGWVITKRADFDQQFMARLASRSNGPADPCETRPPSYVFRWQTGHYHGQGTMRSPEDVTWYDRAANAPVERIDMLVPRFDAETERLYARFVTDSWSMPR